MDTLVFGEWNSVWPKRYPKSRIYQTPVNVHHFSGPFQRHAPLGRTSHLAPALLGFLITTTPGTKCQKITLPITKWCRHQDSFFRASWSTPRFRTPWFKIAFSTKSYHQWRAQHLVDRRESCNIAQGSSGKKRDVASGNTGPWKYWKLVENSFYRHVDYTTTYGTPRRTDFARNCKYIPLSWDSLGVGKKKSL